MAKIQNDGLVVYLPARVNRKRQLAYFREELRFDGTSYDAVRREYRLRCLQCQALTVNGVPSHAANCPTVTTAINEKGATNQ